MSLRATDRDPWVAVCRPWSASRASGRSPTVPLPYPILAYWRRDAVAVLMRRCLGRCCFSARLELCAGSLRPLSCHCAIVVCGSTVVAPLGKHTPT